MSEGPTSGLDPVSAELLQVNAYLHLRYGDAQKAISYLEFLVHLFPADSRLWRSLAMARLRVEDPEKAAEAARSAVDHSQTGNDRRASLLVLILSLKHLGHSQEAGPFLEEYLAGSR